MRLTMENITDDDIEALLCIARLVVEDWATSKLASRVRDLAKMLGDDWDKDETGAKAMREACIILPLAERLNFHHRALNADLLEAFHGVTTVDGQGVWRDPATGNVAWEPVRIYTVAAEPTPVNEDQLAAIAYSAGFRCSQTAIYRCRFDGDVEIVTITY